MPKSVTAIAVGTVILLSAHSVNAEPPKLKAGYDVITLPVGDFVYTHEKGYIEVNPFVTRIGLRLEKALSGGESAFYSEATLYAAAQVQSPDKKHKYKGWIWSVNFPTSAKKPPKYVFVSNEPKQNTDRYPVYFAYSEQDDWHEQFEATRWNNSGRSSPQTPAPLALGDGPNPLYLRPGEGPKPLHYFYCGGEGPQPLIYGNEGPKPFLYGSYGPASMRRGMFGRRCR